MNYRGELIEKKKKKSSFYSNEVIKIVEKYIGKTLIITTPGKKKITWIVYTQLLVKISFLRNANVSLKSALSYFLVQNSSTTMVLSLHEDCLIPGQKAPIFCPWRIL